MTPTQAFFTRGYLGLKAQGFRRSVRPRSTTCLYRGPDNLRCFVGHCIDDDSYSSIMDDAVYNLNDFQKEGLFLDITVEDFNALQRIHDDADSPAEMQLHLEVYAKKRGFDLPTTTTGA